MIGIPVCVSVCLPEQRLLPLNCLSLTEIQINQCLNSVYKQVFIWREIVQTHLRLQPAGQWIDLKITQKHPKWTSTKTYEGIINCVRFDFWVTEWENVWRMKTEKGALTDLQRDVWGDEIRHLKQRNQEGHQDGAECSAEEDIWNYKILL